MAPEGPGAGGSPGEGTPSPGPLVLVFLDGVGVGRDDAGSNPIVRAGARLLRGSGGLLVPLDATLGVPGLPSSGTGQTTLLTGRDAVRRHGAHFGPWTPVRLRGLMARESVLARAVRAGLDVRFLNATPRGWAGSADTRRIPPITLAARAAGLLTRHEDALREGRALASGIVNDAWRQVLRVPGLPDTSPSEAGVRAAHLSEGADLAVFAHFETDRLGHRGTAEEAVRQVERVEAFLEGLVGAAGPGTRILVTSDHGNLEELGSGHTRNPALGLWFAPRADGVASAPPAIRPASLLDVAPLLLAELRLPGLDD